MVNPSHYHQTLSPAPTPPYHHVVPVDPFDPCPPDPEGCAERYCRSQIPEEEAREFEQHCKGCPQCAAILAQEMFVTAMMRAARRAQSPEKP
jgi:hypothetical protein